MSFGWIALGWVGVSLWLLVMNGVTRRFAGGELDALRVRGPHVVTLIEAALVTLLGALWFASLGSGGWWLVFGLLGLVVDLPLHLREGVERRKAKGEGVESQKSKVDGSLASEPGPTGDRTSGFRLSTFDWRFPLSTFDSRGAFLTVLRFLGSGLILSLVL